MVDDLIERLNRTAGALRGMGRQASAERVDEAVSRIEAQAAEIARLRALKEPEQFAAKKEEPADG